MGCYIFNRISNVAAVGVSDYQFYLRIYDDDNFASQSDIRVRAVVSCKGEKYGNYIINEEYNRENLGYACDLVTPKKVEVMAFDLVPS